MDLKGKTVLITGSSRGIGKAIALAFAKRGCNIVLNAAKDREALLKTQEELNLAGYYTYSYLADVSDYEAAKRMFLEVTAAYGGIDILVNNAGTAKWGLFTESAPSDWDEVIGNNLKSVLNCTHLALPKMISQKTGCIINISSIWGEKGASCEAVYSAAKGGVNLFTKAIAREVGPSSIRVNAISCGVISTGMNDSLSDEEKAILADDTALMRFGKAEEVAELAVFLAGDGAGYITGQVITVDGCMI